MKSNISRTILITVLMLSSLLPAMVHAESDNNGMYRNAFTVGAYGRELIEYKRFQANGDSALLASFSISRSINTSDYQSYDPTTSAYYYNDSKTQRSEYDLGLGWRKYLSRDAFSTYWDSKLVLFYLRRVIDQSPSSSTTQTRDYQKGADLYFMFGAEYKFSQSFAVEGRFGMMVNFIRNSRTGFEGGDTKGVATTNSGILVSFYF